MRKILVLLTSVLLLASCLFAFCACSMFGAAEPELKADIVLGASSDESEAPAEGDAEELAFVSTAASEGIFDNIPVVDTPDPTPATLGLRFKLIELGKYDNGERKLVYTVVGYSTFKFLETDVLSQEVYIPYTYEGIPVVAISPRAFEDTNITKVTLPKTLLAIGDKAFYNSTVEELNIPASVLDIADSAFIKCNSLATFSVEADNARYSMTGGALMDGTTLVRGFGNGVIGEGVLEIGANAFRGCDALTDITVPATVTKIGDGAFANCPNLVSATVETALTKLPSNMFDGCSALTSVVLPDTLKEYGYAAFRATGFESFTVPAGVEIVGAEAFAACPNLVSISMSEGIKELGGSAFKNCVNLTELIVPNGTLKLGGNLCNGCTKLAKIWIAPTVTEIGDGAFVNCYRLTELFIPKSVIYLGGAILYGVEKSTVIKIETGFIPLNFASNYNVYLVENAMESGKIPTVVNSLTVARSQSPAPDYALYYGYGAAAE